MKKILLSSLVAMAVAAPAVAAVPSHITRNSEHGYTVTYNYKDKAKTGWYVTGRAELGFWNFKQKYNSDYPVTYDEFNSDSYSFEPVFGGSLAGGAHLNYVWRAELEAGYLGYFSDKDNDVETSISVPYLVANGYRDFSNGLYVGAGVGFALPITKMDAPAFNPGDRSKTNFSPMLGLMLGWSHKLDDSLVLDLRYRLAGVFAVSKQSRTWEEPYIHPVYGLGYQTYSVESKISSLLDNSISIGLRYEF